MFVLPLSTEEIHSHRNGSDSILAKLASLGIKPIFRTIDSTQEAIRIIAKLKSSRKLPSAVLIVPDLPQRFQVGLPQSPLVPVTSIAYPHCGKLKLRLTPTEANGLVDCPKEKHILVRQWDPFYLHLSVLSKLMHYAQDI